jgi:hypothetical protein
MADGTLSFPFRFTPTGAAATVGYGTDAEIDEAIATLTLTQLGERPMAPSYGIPDPAFSGLHTGDVQVGLADHGPAGITITEVTMTPISETASHATIQWSRDTDEEATT